MTAAAEDPRFWVEMLVYFLFLAFLLVPLAYVAGRQHERNHREHARQQRDRSHVRVVEPHPLPAPWAYTDSRGEVATDG